MKRVFFLLLILSLLILPAQAETTADPLLEQAAALAQRLGELAASEGYAAAFGTSEAINAVVAGWANGDYSAPVCVHRATLNGEAALNIVKLLTGSQAYASVEGLSGAAYDELCRRLISSLPSMVNGFAGVETVAAASIMTIQTAFLCETCDEPAFYILSYERGTPVAVTFQPCQDGAVLAQACFLGSPSEDASDAVLSGALAMLSAFGMTQFEEIPLL